MKTDTPATSQLGALDFQPVERLLFGAGRLAEIGELARGLGARRALVVTDPGVVAAGHADEVLASLGRARVERVVFQEVEENPTTVHVERARASARQHRVDFIVAVGGGSVLDCAKGANFLFTNGGAMADYEGFGRASRPMLPSIGVPTTAGTGSETQSFAIIADAESHRKMACGDRKAAFRAVILDPAVTRSLPARVRAATGMDALAHAIESYVTTRGNPISRAFSLEAWRLITASLPVAFEPGEGAAGEEARAAMLLGAALAGLAIENSMLGAAHALANPLTAHHGVVHGVAVALMIPHVIRYNGDSCRAAYGELVAALGDEADAGSGAGDAPEVAAALVERLRDDVALPATLADCGIEAAGIAALAAEAAAQWTARFNPRPVIAADLEELYRRALA